jgi:high-affinity iron transporter
MIQALVVMLREGLEACLIVGIVLAYLTRLGRGDRAAAVWAGVAAAVAVSLVTGGVLAFTVGQLDGHAAHVYDGVAMLLAVGILTWMVFWMRRQARTLGANLRDRVSVALGAGSGVALATVAFVAVAREGIETALFLFSTSSTSSAGAVLAGSAIGGLAALALGVAIYRGSARLDLRQFFRVTSVLLFAFAAYLLVGAFVEFAEAGVGGETAGQVAGIAVALVYGAAVAIAYSGRFSPSRNAAR